MFVAGFECHLEQVGDPGGVVLERLLEPPQIEHGLIRQR